MIRSEFIKLASSVLVLPGVSILSSKKDAPKYLDSCEKIDQYGDFDIFDHEPTVKDFIATRNKFKSQFDQLPLKHPVVLDNLVFIQKPPLEGWTSKWTMGWKYTDKPEAAC